MKILVTGKDKFTYNRTAILLHGLQERGVELIFYPIDSAFDKKRFTTLSATVDLVYIPPFRHSDVRFIKKLSATPVFFDALISKYLTRTIDHGKWWTSIEKSWRDRVAFMYSDVVLMDTELHRNYIIRRYQLDPDRVFSLPVGVDTSLFSPQPKTTHEDFIVGFYGGFIPLQGVEKIIESAHILRDHSDLRFEIIGSGPRLKQAQALAKKLDVKNLEFIGWVPYDSLNDRINKFDLCLGIFGDSLKTDIVIPNKVFHYAALKKCILTKDTPGIKEIFENGENIVTTSNDPSEIAASILKLKENQQFREEMAENSFHLITEEYNHLRIADHFMKIVNKLGISTNRP